MVLLSTVHVPLENKNKKKQKNIQIDLFKNHQDTGMSWWFFTQHKVPDKKKEMLELREWSSGKTHCLGEHLPNAPR